MNPAGERQVSEIRRESGRPFGFGKAILMLETRFSDAGSIPTALRIPPAWRGATGGSDERVTRLSRNGAGLSLILSENTCGMGIFAAIDLAVVAKQLNP
jgi:hypothetical protein